MQELQSRNGIVITEADKGGAVVILDVDEAEWQLNNKENYRKINYDPTTPNNETINKVISRQVSKRSLKFQKENLLSKSISEAPKTENSNTLHFYLKPKIHKEDNPGWPVISSIIFILHKFLNMLIPTFNQLLQKSYRASMIQPTFWGRLTKLALFKTTYTLFL